MKEDFSDSKTVKIKKPTTLRKTIGNLKAGTTYYVQVRTYRVVDKKTYYSDWTKAKTVKTKGKASKKGVTASEVTAESGTQETPVDTPVEALVDLSQEALPTVDENNDGDAPIELTLE